MPKTKWGMEAGQFSYNGDAGLPADAAAIDSLVTVLRALVTEPVAAALARARVKAFAEAMTMTATGRRLCPWLQHRYGRGRDLACSPGGAPAT